MTIATVIQVEFPLLPVSIKYLRRRRESDHRRLGTKLLKPLGLAGKSQITPNHLEQVTLQVHSFAGRSAPQRVMSGPQERSSPGWHPYLRLACWQHAACVLARVPSRGCWTAVRPR